VPFAARIPRWYKTTVIAAIPRIPKREGILLPGQARLPLRTGVAGEMRQEARSLTEKFEGAGRLRSEVIDRLLL
jgi:hypothetical protein